MVPHGRGRGDGYHRAMLLALDIGNTNVTLGLFRAGALVSTRRAATRPDATADEFEATLDALLRLDDASLADVSAIAAASVVPALTAAAIAVAARRERPLLLASPGTMPMAVRVDRPNEVGADRLVNALAAQRLYGTPAVVVDFGTATTFDCIAADGAYVGGAIAPGLELGLEALATRTAKLPRIELRAPVACHRPRHRLGHAGGHGLRLPGAHDRPAGADPRRAGRGQRRRARPTSRRS